MALQHGQRQENPLVQSLLNDGTVKIGRFDNGIDIYKGYLDKWHEQILAIIENAFRVAHSVPLTEDEIVECEDIHW